MFDFSNRINKVGRREYKLAQNFMMAKLDGTFRGTDLKGVEMSWLEHAFVFLK